MCESAEIGVLIMTARPSLAFGGIQPRTPRKARTEFKPGTTTPRRRGQRAAPSGRPVPYRGERRPRARGGRRVGRGWRLRRWRVHAARGGQSLWAAKSWRLAYGPLIPALWLGALVGPSGGDAVLVNGERTGKGL